MEEALDHCGGREPASPPEADGVDAYELVVARSSDEGVEHIEQLSAPGNRSGEPFDSLREEPLIHNRYGGSARHSLIIPLLL